MLNCENEQYEMLLLLSEYRFACLETAEYLDTHPNDKLVLARHNEFCDSLNTLSREYMQKYNDPLSVYDKCDHHWSYIDRFMFGCNGGHN